MTTDEFLDEIKSKGTPVSDKQLTAFERELKTNLPSGYREFLTVCNGGSLGGQLMHPNGETMIHHIGGFREEYYFDLAWHIDCYEDRIPRELLWIMDDPFGNAICLGLTGDARGKIFFGITRWNLILTFGTVRSQQQTTSLRLRIHFETSSLD